MKFGGCDRSHTLFQHAEYDDWITSSFWTEAFERFAAQVVIVALLQAYGESLQFGHTRLRDRHRFWKSLMHGRLFFSDFAMVRAIPPLLEN